MLFDSQAVEDRMAELRNEIESLSSEYSEVSSRLREARLSASVPFAREVTAAIRELELERAVFDVEVTEGPASAKGSDNVRFLFSAAVSSPTDV